MRERRRGALRRLAPALPAVFEGDLSFLRAMLLPQL